MTFSTVELSGAWFGGQGVGAPLGGGDILMSFLGVVILSFGFRIFGQRRLMVRHAPEIFGSTIICSAFSLFATAAFARSLGLAPGVCHQGFAPVSCLDTIQRQNPAAVRLSVRNKHPDLANSRKLTTCQLIATSEGC